MEIPVKISEKQYHKKFEKLLRKKARQAYKNYSLNVFSRKQKLPAMIFKENFREKILKRLGC